MKIQNTEVDDALAMMLWKVTHFCLAHRSSKVFTGMNHQRIFRYIAFCHFTKRLSAVICNGMVQAIAISWPAWREHLELNHAEGRNQFEWKPIGNGDCLFLAEVIGDRKSLTKLWANTIETAPSLLCVPLFTCRRGKLVQLKLDKLERFCRG